jgi:hypothetical protein
MLSAGMPELQFADEIKKLVNKLSLQSSEQEANKLFRLEIDRAQVAFSRRMDNLFHNYNQYDFKSI